MATQGRHFDHNEIRREVKAKQRTRRKNKTPDSHFSIADANADKKRREYRRQASEQNGQRLLGQLLKYGVLRIKATDNRFELNVMDLKRAVKGRQIQWGINHQGDFLIALEHKAVA